MNSNQLTITGPCSFENLSIFLLHGSDSLDGNRFISLEDALEKKCAVVHETGNVGQLEVENLSESFDLFAQAGDIVKGGRQDRALGVDFVVPARSGRVPVPTFCVESGRWHRRAREAAGSFSSSKSYLASKKLRMAAKLSKSQSAVWESVAEVQNELSEGLGTSVHAAGSPTSYLLSVENEELQKRTVAYRAALTSAIDGKPDAIGYAFVINGEINTADSYGSGVLFRKLWSKLLDAAILEAIGEARRNTNSPAVPVSIEAIQQWVVDAEKTTISDRQEVPPRVRVDTRRSEKTVVFDTCDHGFDDAVLHKNLVAK